MPKILVPFAILALICISNVCLASDIEREKRIAKSIKDSIVIGETVNLNAGSVEFLGLINNEEPEELHGSIVILHGMGSNPNAPQVIHPLRSQLAELGWVTASIQLPILAPEAPIKDYLGVIKESSPRIQAALNYMHENFSNKPCVIIAHSLGAVMAVNFLATQEKLACDAAVLIGLPTFSSELPEADSNTLIKKLTLPTLDIFGSQDLDNVKKLAHIRRLTLVKNNPLNRQIEVSGADHAFTGLNDTLVRSIHNWLMHVFKKPDNPL